MPRASKPTQVVHTSWRLGDKDPRFVGSITSTTKSLQATAYRIVAWADALSKALGVNVDVPDSYRTMLATQ